MIMHIIKYMLLTLLVYLTSTVTSVCKCFVSIVCGLYSMIKWSQLIENPGERNSIYDL